MHPESLALMRVRVHVSSRVDKQDTVFYIVVDVGCCNQPDSCFAFEFVCVHHSKFYDFDFHKLNLQLFTSLCATLFSASELLIVHLLSRNQPITDKVD